MDERSAFISWFLEEDKFVEHRKPKSFLVFVSEQDGGLPTAAPANTVGGDRIAGTGSDFPPVPARNKPNKSNIRRRKTATLINNKVIETVQKKGK